MSRIGKNPVAVPSGVQVAMSRQTLTAKGPKGELALRVPDSITATIEGGKIIVAPREKTREARAMWGLQRTLVNNVVRGVSQGYNASLEISGVGFRANVQGPKLTLQLGFSHDVEYDIPKGIEIKVDKQTGIRIAGIDRQLVGQVAAEIRAFRPPEPYKGKGIKYAAEYVRRKEGKKK
jgi:large subunit ribosomal protein L6